MDTKIADDAELKRIRESADPLAPRDETEIAVGLAGEVEIAGRRFPAPSAAVLAMLELIQSPFVGDEDIEPDRLRDIDVFRALYVLRMRQAAVIPILRMKHQEEAIARIKTPSDPAAMFVIVEQYKRLSEIEAQFDADVLKFGESLGPVNIALAANEIGAYLALAGGFEMLPDPEDGGSKKKDVMTSTTSPGLQV